MALASALVGIGPAARTLSYSCSSFSVVSSCSSSSSCTARLSSSTTHRCFHHQQRRHRHQHRHQHQHRISRHRGSTAATAAPSAPTATTGTCTSSSSLAASSSSLAAAAAAHAFQLPPRFFVTSAGRASSAGAASATAAIVVVGTVALLLVGREDGVVMEKEEEEEQQQKSESLPGSPARQGIGPLRRKPLPPQLQLLGGPLLLTSQASTMCEESSSKSPQHFHSAANLFQHHMSKEKEKDDANEYHHDDDEHDDHDHDDHEPKAECFLCRVHRQGPCGNLWKDLEACVDREQRVKGSSGPNNANDPCQSCASQFEGCWKKHAGLYSLIALDEQSQIFQQLKKHMDVQVQETSTSSSGVDVDWNAWKQFVAGSSASHEVVKNYRRRISQNGNIRFRGPLWKRFEKYQMTNPLLVTVVARIPRTVGSDPVRYGVALDQQNRVLGFVEVTPPSDDRDSNSTATPTQDDDSLQMKIILVPGLTESVKIQLWTVSSPSALVGGGHRNRVVVHETSVERVDYGASTNSMLAIQNQRTRTQKVK